MFTDKEIAEIKKAAGQVMQISYSAYGTRTRSDALELYLYGEDNTNMVAAAYKYEDEIRLFFIDEEINFIVSIPTEN